MKLPDSTMDGIVSVFREKREYVMSRLAAIPGLHTPKPEGAFYLLPTVSQYFDKVTDDGTRVRDSGDFCMHLLGRHKVCIVSLSTYVYMRYSF